MDNNKIHIWELPEKLNNIDKSHEYTMVHDGFNLKKVTMKKLHKYFSQNYKIDNMTKYFDVLLETENKRYESLYSELESSLTSYSKTVDEFVEKFDSNRDKIRELETMSNQAYNNMDELSKSFENIKNEFDGLTDIFEEYRNTISQIYNLNGDVNTYITKINESITSIKSIIPVLENDNVSLAEDAIRASNAITSNIRIKGEELTKKINSEYDKILAIIDHYHH